MKKMYPAEMILTVVDGFSKKAGGKWGASPYLALEPNSLKSPFIRKFMPAAESGEAVSVSLEDYLL